MNGCGSGSRRGTASGVPLVVARPPRPFGLHPLEAGPLKVEPVHERLNETNRIVRVHPVVYGLRHKQQLRTIIRLPQADKTRSDSVNSAGIYGSEQVQCRAVNFEKSLMDDVGEAKKKYGELVETIRVEVLGEKEFP